MSSQVARWVAVAWAAVSCGAWAQDDARFAQAKAGAEPLASLQAFLDKYLAECGPPSGESVECAKNEAAFRKQVNGKKHFTVVSEESVLLQVADIRGDDFTFNLTPFFAASSSAITLGAPTRADAKGNPVLPFLAIDGKSPDAMSPQMISRLAGARGLRLEVVFVPQGVWSLPRKGQKPAVGVKAKFEAVRISVARTGEALGTWWAR